MFNAQNEEMARAHLAAIISSSDDAIISKDLKGIITSWNEGAHRLFGYSAEEAIGQPISMLIPEEQRNHEARILAGINRGEHIEHYETVRRSKDGRLLDISLSVSPIRDSTGRIIGASKIARDITEKKRAERELVETTRLLREAQGELQQHAQDLEKKVAERTAELRSTVADLESFSYSISHDLRAPLRAMQGFAQLLQEHYDAKLDEEGRKWLDTIVRAGGRLHQLIEDVLKYSRIGREDLKLRPVALAELVPRIIEEYPNINQANPALTLHQPLHSVMASEPLLAQCLANLFGNAVKFVEPGTRPRIDVRTEQRNGDVRLWIEDNGVGIPPTEHEKIFALFTRGSAPAQVEGTGVGLAIVHRAILRMNGTVGVESEPGHGSKFWIQLPAAEAAK